MKHHIIGIGEVLWDVFPDGPRFGGAPANFCCSAAELALDSAAVQMVSAVGSDELGQQAIDALGKRHVITSAVQVDEHPTGRVLVELDTQGVASYRFDMDSAWDHLRWDEQLKALARNCEAVCFGTLGQRSDTSRKTIQAFVEATPKTALRILDVNVRAPFCSDDVILESLALANILKLNEEELPLVAKLSGRTGSDVEVMRQILHAYDLRCVALTRGAAGAVILSADSCSELPGKTVSVADTVGAGDAFTASMALDLLAGEDLETVNHNAITTASHVCSQPGATMSFPEHLRKK